MRLDDRRWFFNLEMRLPFLLGLYFVAAASTDVLSIDKGVIVHLFEWRWPDIAKECEEFLAPSGFAGVQISPPSENLIVTAPPRPWWERYQPISYEMTTRSGSEEELRDMVSRCNRVGVRVFADAVLNHMAGPANVAGDTAEGTAGSTANPLDYSYPDVPYTRDDFQIPANKEQNSKLEGLRDLDNSKPNVMKKQARYLNKLIDMGFAGFRIDAADHMLPEDLESLFDKLKNLNTKHGFPNNTRPLIYMEAKYNGEEAVDMQKYSSLGLVSDFRFGNALGETFLMGKHDLTWLKDLGTNANLLPDNVGVAFVESHETQRHFASLKLNYKTFRPYKMASAFMLAYPWGTPRILSSFSLDTEGQGPPHDDHYHILPPAPTTSNACANQWVCEHRWRQIYHMVLFHNVVAGTEVKEWRNIGKGQIAFCRGNKGFIAFNLDSSAKLSQTLQTCLPMGKYCDVISGGLVDNKCTGKTVEVGEDGTGAVEIDPYDLYNPNVDSDGVLALHVKAKILDESEINRSKAVPTCEQFMSILLESVPEGFCSSSSIGSSGSSGSAYDKLKSLLLSPRKEGSSSSSSLLGHGHEEFALLKAVVKVRKLEKILDLLSEIDIEDPDSAVHIN